MKKTALILALILISSLFVTVYAADSVSKVYVSICDSEGKLALALEEITVRDADGDGKITASDARYVLRAAVGLEAADKEKLKRVDYFGTGRISSENARLTLRIAVGLDSLYDILLENGILP